MIHFSLHTEYSYLSGASKIEQYVQHCKSNNITHLGITDYGTLSGIIDLQTECDKNGIKPIFGCEVFIARNKSKKNIPDDIKKKIVSESKVGTAEYELNKYASENNYTILEKDIHSLNLWALNNIGLKNLYKITSQAWIDGFYYKPRTDIQSICDDSDGLCIGTGNKDSYINRMILSGNIIGATKLIKDLYFYENFGERLIIELPVQYNMYNKQLVDYYLMIKDEIPNATYIPSSDVHYLHQTDIYKHRVVSTIAKKYHKEGEEIDINSNGLDGDDNYFHTEQEIINRLNKLGVQNSEQYIENSKLLAQKFVAKVDNSPFAMFTPNEIGIPNEKTPQEFLETLCEESKTWNIISDDQKVIYKDRTIRELKALDKQNFTKYVLYIKTILDMARSINCGIGPGRGSAAGSIVNWHLGNTEVDPLKYNLLFERYIDPDRVEPPDNDIDVDPSKRDELIELMRKRWGYNNVAFINNFSKLGGKSAWNDVCRILKVPLNETRELAKNIIEDEENKKHVLESCLKLDVFNNVERKYPNVKKYAIGIEGLLRQTGIHAAGVVCADKELWHYVPVETRNDGENRVLVCAFDKDTIGSTGLLKVDLLGLDTVKTISQCVDEVKKTSPDFTLDAIDFEDKNVINEFTKKNFDGIFQYDSDASRKLCNNLNKFNSFIDISHITALNRPGPLDSGMAYSYIKNCNEENHTTTTYHPKVDHITKDTYGILVYQEQVMRVFADIQGHPKPDKMRKLIAKSKGIDEIEKYRSEFITGSKQKHPDIPEDVLNKLFSDIVTFGNYAFNASHSVAYAKIAYMQQYLKYYYPIEFWFTMIKGAKADDKRSYAYAAKKQGIELVTADVNLSSDGLSYNKDKNVIVGGLLDIKGIGEKAAQEISSNKPYTSFHDFYTRCNRRQVNARVIKALAQSSALDTFIPNTKVFLDEYETLNDEFNKKIPLFNNWDDKLEELSKDKKDFPKWKKKELALLVNTSALIDPFEDVMKELSTDIVISPVALVKPSPASGSDNVVIEKSFLGFWVRGVVIDITNYEHKIRDKELNQISTRDKSVHRYGGVNYYITLLTPNGDTIRVSLSPTLHERIPNFKIEKDNSILVWIQKPFANDKKVKAIFNLSNIDLKDKLYRSLFVKTHPTNNILSKLSDKERKYAEVPCSKLLELTSKNLIQNFNIYGTFVGLDIKQVKAFEVVMISIMTLNGIFCFQIFISPDKVDQLLTRIAIGDFVKAKVGVISYREEYQFRATSIDDIVVA